MILYQIKITFNRFPIHFLLENSFFYFTYVPFFWCSQLQFFHCIIKHLLSFHPLIYFTSFLFFVFFYYWVSLIKALGKLLEFVLWINQNKDSLKIKSTLKAFHFLFYFCCKEMKIIFVIFLSLLYFLLL